MHKHLLDPRVVLKPELQGPADVSVSENHVWSLWLHKVILSLENFGKNALKSYFLYCYNGAHDVNFCYGLECLYVKYKSRASTAQELPDQYMGFVGWNMAVNSVQHSFLCNNVI